MDREYSFNLTIPLADLRTVEELLQEARRRWPFMRISRKPDRHDCARYYLSFPNSGSHPEKAFHEWLGGYLQDSWDLYGPTHGRWGFK